MAGLGQRDKLLEVMSVWDARRAFQHYGATEEQLETERGLKTAFRKLVNKYHPDRGDNDGEAMKEITAAYDVLKKSLGTPHAAVGGSDDDTGGSSSPFDQVPIWAMAGYSGGAYPNGSIRRQNYTDMNFFKKRMWELSDHSNTEWTIWQFDGHFFRNTITVFGSEDIFHEMAEAMLIWGSSGNPYNTRAIFVSRKNDDILYCIYADGKFYNRHPIPFEHESFNSNPANDQHFVRSLPGKLDMMKQNHALSSE
jgi:hypothetical protein